MDRSPLRVSPVAALLVDLAERRDTGRLLLGDRSLLVSAGELAHVSGAPQDYHFHEFLLRSGQLTREQCAQVEARAQAEQSDFYRALLASELLPAAEVRSQRRALWLERLARALREHIETPVGADIWSADGERLDAETLPAERARLVPLLLDALARSTRRAEAEQLESASELRWFWTPRGAGNDAKQWASLGELPDGAALSLAFAKRPRCAPQLAALLRTGLARLEAAAPRAQVARVSIAPTIADAVAASLAPPPPRLSRAPTAAWSQQPPAPLEEAPPAERRQRVHLDPGGSGDSIDEIPRLEAIAWPRRLGPLHDPLREIELKLDECADPERRAELFSVLAELWDQRIGSLEEAARNYREAAAALPNDARCLLQAARACFRIGHGALAVRYVLAALPECQAKELRLEALQLLASMQERLGDAAASSTLKRAAAEDSALAWPHERLAQIQLGRGSLPLAAAQLRAAAHAERERAPQRALANYAQAYAFHPEDDALASDYADALSGLGQPETAAAILTQTAQRATPELRQRLLREAAQHAQPGVRAGDDKPAHERARELIERARQLEQRADWDGALDQAESALTLDPSAAEAAMIALRHLQRRPPAETLLLLGRIQRLLGSSPAVLRASADTHARAGALDAQRRALSELIRRGPNLTEPRIAWLQSWLASDSAQGIERAAHELMTHVYAAHACVDGPLKAAIARLAELGAPAAAAQLAERLLASTGQLDPQYADYAHELARKSGKSTLSLRACERAASAHTGAGRAERLLQIAERHAAAADRAAELRALLRAAAVPEGRERALELLAARYAELADLQRLLTVLALRLDATSELSARRELLFKMASAAVTLADDRMRASAIVQQLLHENAGDRAGLLFGLGALFALGGSDWAFQTARELLARLPPGSAGTCYLWLAHRAEGHDGSASLALELALEGARRFQAEGELLLLAERLTLAHGDKSGILALYTALIAEACGRHGLRALHYRAGRWLERFGAYDEALEHYQRAFELAPRAGAISTALERCKLAALRQNPHAPHASAAAGAAPARERERDGREEALYERFRSGDVAALQDLVDRVRADAERDEETLALLTSLVRAAPERTELLRELQERSLRAGASAQARICDQIASLFDVRFPAHPRVVFAPAELPPDELWQVVGSERAPGLSRLLRLLWRHVQHLPQLSPTVEPATLGAPWDAAISDEAALPGAYERVLAALDRPRAPVYLRPSLSREVSAVPTPGVVLLVRRGLTHEAALEFQLARALVACEPEHALVTALPERAVRRVLHTLIATFGPDTDVTELARVDPKLGALLQSRLSGDEQAELQALVAAHAHELDYARLQRDAERCAVRAGVLVSGDIRASLEALARTQPPLAACNIESEQGFAEACRASSAFAEAVRTALSLPFIGCTELALEAAAETL